MTRDPLEDGSADEGEGHRPPDLSWPDVRAWLQARPEALAEDRELLEELNLRPSGRNVVEFGRAALTRLEAAAEREADARKRIESVAQANFAAQTQTHAAVLDLLQARNHSDLVRRLDVAARERFGLVGAVAALEPPGGIPFGWKRLIEGGVDALVGRDGLAWLGRWSPAHGLFDPEVTPVKSLALIRIQPQFPGDETPGRPALAAFASGAEDGFTPDMGCELVAFLARVVERTAERWPVLT